MADFLIRKQRSETMAKVRSRDTKPEWILRCGLHRLGFRYRLENKTLPGRPDLLFSKYRAAVFVHGCFWHRHPGCKEASTPKTNVDFWLKKFSKNVERDRQTKIKLENLGWRILVVWECELTSQTVETLQRVADWLMQGNYGDCDCVSRKELLAVAEEKVRYRIDSYEKNKKLKAFRSTDKEKR